MCQYCQGRGFSPAFAPVGQAITCRGCGGSGIASCSEGMVGTAAVPGDAVVLHLSPERRLLLRQELYHRAHTIELQARQASRRGNRQRSLWQRAEHLRAVADQLA